MLDDVTNSFVDKFYKFVYTDDWYVPILSDKVCPSMLFVTCK